MGWWVEDCNGHVLWAEDPVPGWGVLACFDHAFVGSYVCFADIAVGGIGVSFCHCSTYLFQCSHRFCGMDAE